MRTYTVEPSPSYALKKQINLVRKVEHLSGGFQPCPPGSLSARPVAPFVRISWRLGPPLSQIPSLSGSHQRHCSGELVDGWAMQIIVRNSLVAYNRKRKHISLSTWSRSSLSVDQSLDSQKLSHMPSLASESFSRLFQPPWTP